MSDELIVVLAGQPIGNIIRDSDGQLTLHFTDEYLSQRLPIPLSVSMPTTTKVHRHDVVHPWLQGLLPDSADVLRRWADRFDVSASSPFSLLTSPVGLDCAGAVQFCRVVDLDAVLRRLGDAEPLDEAAVAARIRELRAEPAAWLGQSGGKFSLGGAQSKTALRREGDQWLEASGTVPTTHILKPSSAGIAAQHINEHLCMTSARILGLPAAVTSIERFEDQEVLVVERFDRVVGAHDRIHQEDMCQAMSVSPVKKYESDGGPAAEGIVEVIRDNVAGASAETDVRRFVDALVFNWIIAGTDAHAKNYSLLLSAGGVRLAPLYDVASFLPYDESSEHRVKFAMKLGGEYKLRRTDRLGTWTKVARELRIPPEGLLERAHDLARSTAAAFAASLVTLPDPAGEFPHILLKLVAGRAARCTAVLAQELDELT